MIPQARPPRSRHGIVSRKSADTAPGKEAPNAAGSMWGHTWNSSVRPLAKRAPRSLHEQARERRPENPWWFAFQKDRESGTGASTYWQIWYAIYVPQ